MARPYNFGDLQLPINKIETWSIDYLKDKNKDLVAELDKQVIKQMDEKRKKLIERIEIKPCEIDTVNMRLKYNRLKEREKRNLNKIK